MVDGGQTREYFGALDGLRALAVLAVLVFHADLGVATGGFLGVSVFFTLSGFLITGLLLAERRTEPVGKHARHHIGAGARSIGNDDADRPLGIGGLGLRRFGCKQHNRDHELQ